MSSVEVVYDRIGEEGVITDLDPTELNQRQLARAVNSIYRNGVLGGHGALTLPIPDGNRWVGQLRGVLRAIDVPFHVATTGKGGASPGGIWTVAPTVISGGTPYPNVDLLPLVSYGNEVLLFPQDGVSSIVRWYLDAEDLTAPAGTVTGVTGQNILTGVGSNFLTGVPRFIGFPGGPISYRLSRAGAATSLVLATPIGRTIGPGAGWFRSTRGVLGLCALVTDRGTATMTGNQLDASGPFFTADYDDQAAVKLGDIAGPRDGATSTGRVSTITDADTLQLDVPPAGMGSAVPYEVLRPLPGRTGCLHRGRLHVSGIEWARNRVYILPQGYDFGVEFNGINSATVDVVQARKSKFQDVPATNTSGRVVALLSVGSYVLVLRDTNVFALGGEYPANSVDLVWDGDGCIDVRSAIQTRYGAVWAGQKGIYVLQGTRPKDITAGKRAREWQRLVANLATPTEQFVTALERGSVSCRALGRHLFVTVVAGSTPGQLQPPTTETWIYDLEADAWRSNQEDMAALSYAWSMDEDDEYLYWGATNGGIGNVFRSQFEQTNPDTPVQPGFYAETGALNGIGRQDRLTNLLVSHEAVARTVSDQARLRVLTGTRDLTEATVIVGSAPETRGDPRTARIRPRTNPAVPIGGAIGRVTNHVRLAFEDVGVGSSSAVRIHDVKAIVRRKRARA